jgi:DNA-3-methyladenine glycosylase
MGASINEYAVRRIDFTGCDHGRVDRSTQRLERVFFEREVTAVARDLLGRVVSAGEGVARVGVRLTEVEAYRGRDDSASHAFRGPTPRTAVMFGPAGHLYTYFVYGMHWCANIVTGPNGQPSAVLLRAGEVVDGVEIARGRRPKVADDRLLARGPAGLATVLGLDGSSSGADLCLPTSAIKVNVGTPVPDGAIRTGPRVGVATAADLELRFWIADDPTVSVFRAWTPRRAKRVG